MGWWVADEFLKGITIGLNWTVPALKVVIVVRMLVEIVRISLQ